MSILSPIDSAVAPVEEFAYNIRYEGGDADQHEIDLSQLGISLQGFARVIAVCAHFSQTAKYNKQYDTLSVQVLAAPVTDHRCYEVLVTIKDFMSSKELWSGFAGSVFTAVLAVVLNRRKAEEMKLLNEALQKSLAQNEAMQTRLLQTIDKMVDALQPAVKQAHAPIGRSVSKIAIYQQGKDDPATVLDRASKELANAPKDTKITETKPFLGLISELDMLSGNCKISLDGSPPDERINAVITDPVVQRPDNPYVAAMSRIAPVTFLAKAEVDPDGEIVKLHISDLST